MRKLWIATALLAAVGCDNVDVGLVPLFVTVPEFDEQARSCTFNPSGEALVDIRMDLAQQTVLRLDVVTRNALDGADVLVEPGPPPQSFPNTNTLTPVRFDYRWECDASGFTADLGPLVLPAFSGDVKRPFCLDSRNDASKNFVGFDVVSATGSALRPGQQGFIHVRPVTAQLGQAFSDFFEISERAEQCCRDVDGCENLPAMAQGALACTALQSIFDRVAGPGALDVRKVDDVQRFRPYAAFTGIGYGSISRPAYYMRLRGSFEAVSSVGTLFTSTEYLTDIGFCRSGNCGIGVIESCMSN